MSRIAEHGEGFVLGIIHQEIAVSQIQYAGLSGWVAFGVPFGRPEFPADLKCDNRLARAGGHRQQHTLFALDDGLHRAVNCDSLVIAGFLAGGEVGRGEQVIDGGGGEFFRATQA